MPKITRLYGGDAEAIPLKARYRKGRGRKAPIITVICGCCGRTIEIRPANDPKSHLPTGEGIEIGDVMASVGQWRELLLPLLGVDLAKGKVRSRGRS